MKSIVPALASVMWVTLALTNVTRFVREVVAHPGEISWSAYGYAALAGVAVAFAASQITRHVKIQNPK